MVIIGNKSGQLGNRLFIFAHFIANAIEFGYEVWNPSFYDYAGYFESTRRDFFCRFPARPTRLGHAPALQSAFYNSIFYPAVLCHRIGFSNSWLRVVNIWRSHDQRQVYDLTSDEFIRLRKHSRVLIAQGWFFRDYANFAKHAAALREFFTPIELHARNVARLMDAARRDGDVLVGAHIRQGDYADLSGGKYLYTTRQYVELFKRATSLWRGKRVKFLICSNMPQDETLFQGLNFTKGNNDLIEDMYALARCDYLIGPPSTFTMWASFYGAVPLFQIEAIDTPIDLARFQVHQG
jgi:hypothetical protein